MMAMIVAVLIAALIIFFVLWLVNFTVALVQLYKATKRANEAKQRLRALIERGRKEADEAHNELGGAAVRGSESGVGTGEATID